MQKEHTQMNNNIHYTGPFMAATSDRDDDQLVSIEDIKLAMEVEND